MRRPWRVTIVSTVTSTVTVDAHSPEEAEVVAEAYVEDGELGDEVSRETVIEDVEPIDFGTLGEEQEES